MVLARLVLGRGYNIYADRSLLHEYVYIHFYVGYKDDPKPTHMYKTVIVNLDTGKTEIIEDTYDEQDGWVMFYRNL